MLNTELLKFVVHAVGCSTITLLGLVTVAALLPLLEPVPAAAQRVVPWLNEDCPIGYADTRNGLCCIFGHRVEQLQPSQGRHFSAQSINVGGCYCRRE